MGIEILPHLFMNNILVHVHGFLEAQVNGQRLGFLSSLIVNLLIVEYMGFVLALVEEYPYTEVPTTEQPPCRG